MKVRPLHDRVLIKRVEEETKTAGGIVLPGTAAEKPSRGNVIAVGRGKLLENGDIRSLDVKEGNQVLFGKYSGSEVKVDGEDYIIMREDEIMAVIEANRRFISATERKDIWQLKMYASVMMRVSAWSTASTCWPMRSR